jgi:hypothetical protein
MMKNKRIAYFLILLFIRVSSYSIAQDIIGNKAEEEWEKEWIKIKEQAEKYMAEQQAKIHTLNDLEGTLWISVNTIDKRKISWDFAFLTDDLVLLFDVFFEGIRSPSCLIRYSIQDNKIYFTEILIGYLEDEYLVIGNEREEYYEKFKLYHVFDFLDEQARKVGKWCGREIWYNNKGNFSVDNAVDIINYTFNELGSNYEAE